MKQRPDTPPFRAIGGYGDPAELADRVILPPAKYANRYGVTARGTIPADGPTFELVTITDRETGASLAVPMRGGPITASLPADLAPANLALLWRDGRYLAGWLRRSVGRPPGLTTITDDDQLRPSILAMRRDRVRVTRPALASRAGFTVDEIDGYLRVTGRTFAEFLRSF